MESWDFVKGRMDSPCLLIADHASNHVPAGIDLGITSDLLNTHIALDIGVTELGQTMCQALDCSGIFGAVSRLVIDLNREEDAAQVIPESSDGHAIQGNRLDEATKAQRIDHYWRPYHERIGAQIRYQRPKLLISLHSFTPQLSTRPDEARPWEVGILYNEDARAARIAIQFLAEAGVTVGDQLPYSGKLLNATMNLHGEGNGIAYLGIEMRQDLIASDAGVALWSPVLVLAVKACLAGLD